MMYGRARFHISFIVKLVLCVVTNLVKFLFVVKFFIISVTII